MNLNKEIASKVFQDPTKKCKERLTIATEKYYNFQEISTKPDLREIPLRIKCESSEKN